MDRGTARLMRAQADSDVDVSSAPPRCRIGRCLDQEGEQVQTRNTLWTIMLVAIRLFAILVAAFWYSARAWTSLSGSPMPAVGYVTLTLGVVFSLVFGF
jgi:hypothetical protein